MRDELFLRTKVPMTKAEVRAISIDHLQLQGKRQFLDIGAGTGSVSLQAALMYPELQVTAIEKSDAAIDIMHQNMVKFGTDNLTLIQGEAPIAIPNQQYDAIFVGGSGSNLDEIIDFALAHLTAGGALVLNFILQENALQAYQYLTTKRITELEMLEARIAKWHALGKGHYFKPQNPTLIISATRKD